LRPRQQWQAPATAMAGTSDCASGYFCVWKDTNFKTASAGGNLVRFQYYIPDYNLWDYKNTNTSAGDSITSFYNHSSGGNDVYIYKGTSGRSNRYGVGPGSARSNLATSFGPIGWNDAINSAYYEYYDPNI